jgi:hypothetical protein
MIMIMTMIITIILVPIILEAVIIVLNVFLDIHLHHVHIYVHAHVDVRVDALSKTLFVLKEEDNFCFRCWEYSQTKLEITSFGESGNLNIVSELSLPKWQECEAPIPQNSWAIHRLHRLSCANVGAYPVGLPSPNVVSKTTFLVLNFPHLEKCFKKETIRVANLIPSN